MFELDALSTNSTPNVAALLEKNLAGPQFLSVDSLLPFETVMDWEIACLAQACFPFADPNCLVWSMPQCLVVPKSLSSKPQFGFACHEMESLGWPVKIRQTGGDLTPQSPGVINVSYITSQPWTETTGITSAYEALCQPIVDYLKRDWGVSSYCSAVDGAFCDGKFNVVVDGLKIAGTAQKWRQFKDEAGQAHVAILGHVAILADAHLEALMGASNIFYQLCEIDKTIQLPNHTTLLKLFGEEEFDQLEIMAGLARSFERASKLKV